LGSSASGAACSALRKLASAASLFLSARCASPMRRCAAQALGWARSRRSQVEIACARWPLRISAVASVSSSCGFSGSALTACCSMGTASFGVLVSSM